MAVTNTKSGGFLNAGFCEVVEEKKAEKVERAVSKKSTKRTTRAK